MNLFRKIYRKVRQLIKKRPLAAALSAMIAFYYLNKASQATIPSMKLSYFLLALSQNVVSEVIIKNNNTILFKASNNGGQYYETNSSLLTKDRLFKLLAQERHQNDKPNVTFSCMEDLPQQNNTTGLFLLMGIGSLIGYKLFNEMVSGGYKPQSADPDDQKVLFSDIHGLQHAKSSLRQIIDFLKNPEKYQKVGARLRRGILIHGPPGTGQTMLARATASESQSNFLYASASQFIEMYVGVGAKRVRELFQRAKQMQPCIIFVDEIDCLGQRKKGFGGEQQHGSESERTSTLNQLLTQMDGFKDVGNVVVIAATNRINMIDDALLRSGRFDTKIKLDMPNQQDRLGILSVHLKTKQHDIGEQILKNIAQSATNVSGADIENMVNESAYACVHQDSEVIHDKHLIEAFKKISTEQSYQGNQNIK